jgi:hypothetical protein
VQAPLERSQTMKSPSSEVSVEQLLHENPIETKVVGAA